MDYYGSSSGPRGRSSYRGGSFRGSPRGESSYRGSRGSSRGVYKGRGRGSAASSYYPEYDTSSSKYTAADSNNYGSTRGYEYTRRVEASYPSRDHRDSAESLSRKRRSEAYGPPQGVYSRREEEYRPSSRYSGESRSYEERRPFKKPRLSEYKSIKEDYRVKEPLRPRSVRGRGIMRRGRDIFGSRLSRVGSSATATTKEILAIRRAKLLQNRLKNASADKAKDAEKIKEKKSVEGDEVAAATDGEKENADAKDGEEGAKKEKADSADEVALRTTLYGRPFMKLQCPQCSMKCVTFKEYSAHLHSPFHVQAMKEKSDELKSKLAAMRIAQREKQKALDAEDLEDMNTRTFFCLICKLNSSQDRTSHQETELHKKLKAFLMPHCKICRISFQSPMSYETHLCSLTHIRRKHSEEQRGKSGSGLLDKFMVLDSVGGGDEADDKEEDGLTPEPEAKEEDLILGTEFIRTVKAKYCEVCRSYLPRLKDSEKALKLHCRTKEHLRCYLHFGNETLLEKMNEDDDADEIKKKDDKSAEEKEREGDEGLEGDKVWAGLGKLLDESQPGNKSDDEDEEEGGRFDKFKTDEKKENGDISTEEQEKDDVTPDLASAAVEVEGTA